MDVSCLGGGFGGPDPPPPRVTKGCQKIKGKRKKRGREGKRKKKGKKGEQEREKVVRKVNQLDERGAVQAQYSLRSPGKKIRGAKLMGWGQHSSTLLQGAKINYSLSPRMCDLLDTPRGYAPDELTCVPPPSFFNYSCMGKA